MKHAFLVMAHANYPLLSRIIRKIDHPDNSIYIHIDAKSEFTEKDRMLLENSCCFSDIRFIERRKITWGGYSLINLQLRLLQSAVSKGYDYYHYLSGNCFLTKPMEVFHRFFEANNGWEFVEFFSDDFNKRSKGRYAYYHLFRERCGRNRKNPFYWLNAAVVRLQKILQIDRTRRYPDIRFRCGSQWCSITHDFAQYLLGKEPLIKKVFRYCNCADEVFIQTILAASPFAHNTYGERYSIEGSDSCLRSIDWSRPGQLEASPHVFTIEDYEQIMQSNNLFCRKVTDQTPMCEALINKLEEI